MSTDIFLEIFLVIQVLFLVGLALAAFRHASKNKNTVEATPQPVIPAPIPASIHELPEATQQQLLRAAEQRFRLAMDHAANELQSELQHSGIEVNQLLQRLATEIVSSEMDRYKNQLIQIQNQAKTGLDAVRLELDKHRAELEAKMAEEVGAEKLKLIKQLDAKLADAVNSFLLDALQHNIDLGNQQEYLIGLLEEHKAEFVKEVADGNPLTR